MAEPARSWRVACIMAAAGDAAADALATALAAGGLSPLRATQFAQGLGLLCRPGVPPPAVAILLGPLSGMAETTIAKAARALPGLADLPLLIVGKAPEGAARCLAFPPPPDVPLLCRLAGQDPADWPGQSRPAEPVLDPAPLQALEHASPGVAAHILAIMQLDLRTAGERLPRHLGAGDLPALHAAAHKLKGSAGSIGAYELAKASGVLEMAARAGDHAGCHQALPAVLAGIDRLLRHLA